MSDLSLSIDWDSILAESAAETVRAFDQLKAIDWDAAVMAESTRASQQLEDIDWRAELIA